MTRLRTLTLSPKMLVVALLGTLLVLIAATWLIIIAPQRSKSNSLASQIQVAKATLDARKHLSAQHSTQKSQSVFIRRALPDVVAMPQVILELSRVASEEHLSLDSIIPAALTSYSGFEAQPLTVIVSGRFADVESFLQEVRNQVRVGVSSLYATGRLFDVQGISFALGAKAPLVSATLNMNVFAYSAIASGGTASAATTGATG